MHGMSAYSPSGEWGEEHIDGQIAETCSGMSVVIVQLGACMVPADLVLLPTRPMSASGSARVEAMKLKHIRNGIIKEKTFCGSLQTTAINV